MIFKITHKNVQYEYEIGESRQARQACESLNRYNLYKNYDDLKSTFANLHWSVNRDSPYKRNACLAAECFALNVIPTLQSNLERLFVAISITSIFLNADETVRSVWEIAQQVFSAQLQWTNLNFEEAKKLGLCVAPVKIPKSAI